jgi:potassium efflux system protein
MGNLLLAAAFALTALAAPAAPATKSAAVETQLPPAQLPPAQLPPALSDAINDALNALPRKRDLDADQRKQAEELLRDALADDQRASEYVSQRQSFADAAQQARTAAQRAPAPARDLGMALADWRAKLPQDANTDQLSDVLEQERNLLAAAQDSLRSLEDTLQKQTQRPDTLRDELAAARIEPEPAAAPAAGTPATLIEALRVRAQAAQRLQRCRLAALEMEQRSFEPRVRTLFAQRSERRRDIDEHGQRVHLLENMLLDHANSAVTDLVAHLARERDALTAAKAAPVLLDAASANLEFGRDLLATVKRIGVLRDLKNQYTSDHAATELAVKNTQARIELGGISEEVGALLLAERRKLKPLTTLNRDLSGLRGELAQTKLALLDLRDQQDGLENMSGAIAALLLRAGQLPVIAGDLHDGLQRLLGARGDLLTRLTAGKSRQVSLLSDTEQQLAGFVASTTSLGDLLDAHLLGTPSHAAINLGWFADLANSLRAVAHADNEKQAAGLLDNFRHGGFALPALALALLGAALFARWRVPALLERIAAPMRRIRTDRYRYTLQVLALTVLAAAPLALLWAVLGRDLLLAPHIDALEGSLGIATGSVALPWFTLAFVHWLTREDGLAHLHFRWPRARRTALRTALPWLALAILLPMFIHLWLREIGSNETDATIGRALFILGALAVAAIAWRLLRPGAVWTQRGKIDNEPVRARQIARVGVGGFFLAIAVLAAIGYFFTAVTLAEHALASLIAVLGAGVLHGMAVRWLMLGERRLALKRLEEKRAAEIESRSEDTGGEALPEVEAEELAVSDLGAQTRRVLRLAIVLLLGAALLLIWSDIAPALSFLDKIAVWKSTYADTDGKQIAFDVTVRSVFESLLIIAMTFIATRNLPGLLEIGVLRRLQIDAPTRYAITSIVRYLIVLIGVLVGVGLLGVRWSNLQWLAAGLTVGLGFGLQEIFANFVSGLIVLFERPVRVGDIVTIGDVEGTVARIRTRATTIVDWDNKEVIVPNKSFITDRLVNWTLSDTTTRVVIKVGVAYRNDPRLAQKLLLETAAAHELVLKDPAPLAWMMGFGDSTQDFELRFFVAEINQRNLVRTELQMRIAEVFREHDIEIAFPQRDVWLRNTLETNAPPQPAPSADAIRDSKRD